MNGENTKQNENCFALNFGLYDKQLSIPYISITPGFNIKINSNFPISCFFVIIGGKYLNLIEEVMEKVNSVTNDVGGIRQMAVFLMSKTNYKENVDIDYGFVRQKSSPVMVK